MTFPSVITTYDKDRTFDDFAKIEYAFKAKKVTRHREILSRKVGGGGVREILAPQLKDLSFQYGFFDADNEVIEWSDTWSGEEFEAIPRAVKVTMTVSFYDKDKNKIEDKKLQKKIWIPHGVWGSE